MKKSLSSSELAWSIDTNPSMVRRVIGMLAAAGLVHTNAGPSGGARLAKPPKEITLDLVLDAVELKGNLESHDANTACPVGAVIQQPIDEIFAKVQAVTRNVYATTTIASIARQTGKLVKQNA